MVSQLTIFTSISFYSAVCFSSKTATHNHDSETERNSTAQLFESRLALNPVSYTHLTLPTIYSV